MSNIRIVAEPSQGENPRAHWPEELQNEFDQNYDNGVVGHTLVSETDDVRVWHLVLKPGMRCPFHRHVLNYFWSSHSNGVARGYYEDGRIQDVTHFDGETKHFSFGKGEGFTHAVENIGTEDLVFTTVEFKNSLNTPLPIDSAVRLNEATWISRTDNK